MSDQETEEELVPEATVKKYLTVRTEGKRQVKRLLDYYNLDMNNYFSYFSCLSWLSKEADHETQV